MSGVADSRDELSAEIAENLFGILQNHSSTQQHPPLFSIFFMRPNSLLCDLCDLILYVTYGIYAT